MPNVPLVFEVAKTGRASCKNSACGNAAIAKGVLRVGTIVSIGGHDSTAWHHACCITERQLKNQGDDKPASHPSYASLPDAAKKVLDDFVWTGKAEGRFKCANLDPVAQLAWLNANADKQDGSDDGDDDSASSSAASSSSRSSCLPSRGRCR